MRKKKEEEGKEEVEEGKGISFFVLCLNRKGSLLFVSSCSEEPQCFYREEG